MAEVQQIMRRIMMNVYYVDGQYSSDKIVVQVVQVSKKKASFHSRQLGALSSAHD